MSNNKLTVKDILDISPKFPVTYELPSYRKERHIRHERVNARTV